MHHGFQFYFFRGWEDCTAHHYSSSCSVMTWKYLQYFRYTGVFSFSHSDFCFNNRQRITVEVAYFAKWRAKNKHSSSSFFFKGLMSGHPLMLKILQHKAKAEKKDEKLRILSERKNRILFGAGWHSQWSLNPGNIR